jgi:putative zinc finger protein
VRDLLPLFTEEELDPIRARLVRSHLDGCETCRAERGVLDDERLWLLEEMVKSPPLSSRLRGKVIDRIRSRERIERARRRRSILVRVSGLVAAAAIAVGIGVALDGSWRTGQGGPETTGVASEVPRIPLTEHRLSPAIDLDSAANGVPPAAEEIEARGRPPSFGDVLGLVRQIVPAGAAMHPGEPCPPDPNKDGRVDIIDVAYSCQIIMGAPPPGNIAGGIGGIDTAPADPECDEHCLRV